MTTATGPRCPEREIRGGWARTIATRRKSRPPIVGWFGAMWLFIVFVSVHDGYLVALRRDVIRHSEKNPVGRCLIEWNGGDIWLLLTVKAVGTAVTCSVLLLLYRSRRQLGFAVAGPVACFQLGLLLYMTFQ